MGDGESDNSDSADEYERQASFPTPAPHGFAEPGEIGEDMIDDLLVVWRGRAMRNGVSQGQGPLQWQADDRVLRAFPGFNQRQSKT